MTKIEDAMRLVEQGVNPHAAARQAGMHSSSALYVAIKRKKARLAGKCPCCGQQLPTLGKTIDHGGEIA